MRILATTVILAFFAAAAFAGIEQRHESGAMCATIWMPVCAAKGDETRTFANACTAQSAGWTISGQGTCDGGTGRRIGLCFGEECREPTAAFAPAPIR
jgi:hypothetical protein